MSIHAKQWLSKELERGVMLKVVKNGVRIYTAKLLEAGCYELYSDYGYHYGLELEEALTGFLEDIKRAFLVDEDGAIEMVQVTQ